MPRIVLIDDDEIVREAIGRFLSLQGYEFAAVGTGRDGIRLALDWRPAVTVVDFRLPDMSGLEVLAELAASCPGTARILLTGHATLDIAIQAMRLGSCDCLTKPVLLQDFLTAVERVAPRQAGQFETATHENRDVAPEAHAAVRWAGPVERAIDAPRDPRTLRELARAVAVSVGTFRNWCRTARVKSRASLDFARALRAVSLFERDQSTRPENLLSIVDRRTIAKFVRKSGGEADRLPDSVTDFLERQQFITNREAVAAVRAALLARTRPSQARGPVSGASPLRTPTVAEVSLAREIRDTAADRQ